MVITTRVTNLETAMIIGNSNHCNPLNWERKLYLHYNTNSISIRKISINSPFKQSGPVYDSTVDELLITQFRAYQGYPARDRHGRVAGAY